jgi:CheY-like chemotaxis protein
MFPPLQPHILVVNHTPEILALMQELLEGAGYRVSTLPRTGHNLETIVELAPDLLVLDYMWPTSDNEWTLLNMLTIDPRTSAIPVILCTAAIRHVEDMQGHLEQIGVRVVYKPFNIDDLLAVISSTLEGVAVPRQAMPDGLEGHRPV